MPNSPLSEKSPGVLLVVLVLMTLLSYTILPSLFMMLGASLVGVSLSDLMSAVSSSESNTTFQNVYMAVQGISSLLSFVVLPLLFIIYYEKEQLESYFDSKNVSLPALGILAIMTLVLMMVNSVFIEWNVNVRFPEGFHSFAKELEQMAEEATTFLTDFYSLPYFMATFIVVAIIPALGEELLFRGLIQKYISKMSNNPHLAIWLTAAFFSAFHMQFFGFVPRMILGAFFGYIFYFSGSLWYAIAAHFVNNGFTLVMLYFFQKGIIEYNIDDGEPISLSMSALFFVIGAILFVLFVKQFQKNDNLEE